MDHDLPYCMLMSNFGLCLQTYCSTGICRLSAADNERGIENDRKIVFLQCAIVSAWPYREPSLDFMQLGIFQVLMENSSLWCGFVARLEQVDCISMQRSGK